MRCSTKIAIVSLCLPVTACASPRVPTQQAYEPRSIAPATPSQSIGELNALTKTQMGAWINCALAASARYASSNEVADVVARAALTNCSDKEREYRQAIEMHNRTGASSFDVMETRRGVLREHMVGWVVDRRHNLVAFRRNSEAWAECLIDTVPSLAKNERSTPEIAKAALVSCQAAENRMQVQLQSLVDSPDDFLKEYKLKAVPVLLRYIDEVKSSIGGGPKPARPEIVI